MYRDHSVRTIVIRGRIDQLDPDDRDYVGAAAQLERMGVIDAVDIPARKFAGHRTIDLDFCRCLSLIEARDVMNQAREALLRLAEVRGQPFSVIVDAVNGTEPQALRDLEADLLASETFTPAVEPAPADGPTTG